MDTKLNCTHCKYHERKDYSCAHSIYMKLIYSSSKYTGINDFMKSIGLDNGNRNHNDILFKNCRVKLKDGLLP